MMKGLIFFGTVLVLGKFVSGYVDYHIKCSKEQLGIRWPSYHSNSDYYVCQREDGKQVTLTCNPGEVFTYVLQMCTSPAKFIPPPPMDRLSISQNSHITTTSGNYNVANNLNKPLYLTPLHPTEMENSLAVQPPIIIQEPLQAYTEYPSIHLPIIDESKFPEIFHNSGDSEENNKINSLPVGPERPIENSAVRPMVPLPPTPAPTPPVVKPTPPGNTNEKKKPPTSQSAKKPSTPKLNKKPPTAPKAVKKTILVKP